MSDLRKDAVINRRLRHGHSGRHFITLRHGIYNFHPSDVAAGHGTGPVIGSSPPIRVVDEQGRLPAEQQQICNKMIEGLSPLVVNVLDALQKLHADQRQRWLRPQDLFSEVPEAIRRRLQQPLTMPLPSPAVELFQ